MLKRTIFVVMAASLGLFAQQQPGPAPAGGNAQQQHSLKGVVLKNQAPVSAEVLKPKLPRPVERKLKNGLPLVIFENRRVPTVMIDLVLPASTLSDPSGRPGVAAATAELLKSGTPTRNSRQISERLSDLGASLNVYAETGARSTHLTASTLSENLDETLDILADVLLNPAFPQDELDKWKNRTMTFLQQARSQEFFLGNEMQMKVLYPKDARSVIAPTMESIKKITREDLNAYYKKYYRPGNSILGVTGDVGVKEIVAKLEARLARWESGTVEEPKLPFEPPIAEKKILLINRPSSVQTYLMFTNRAIDRMHPDYVAVQVMNRVLGAGPSARLFRNIREDKGYSYGVGSGFAALRYMHHFNANGSVRTEVTGPAIDEFLKEFADIRDRAVPKDELENAKRAIVAGFALGLENQQGVLRQTLLLREYKLPDDYWDKYPERVMAITAEDVQRVARKYIPLENAQLIAVGDAAKVKEVLMKYGPVELYNPEGQKIPE